MNSIRFAKYSDCIDDLSHYWAIAGKYIRGLMLVFYYPSKGMSDNLFMCKIVKTKVSTSVHDCQIEGADSFMIPPDKMIQLATHNCKVYQTEIGHVAFNKYLDNPAILNQTHQLARFAMQELQESLELRDIRVLFRDDRIPETRELVRDLENKYPGINLNVHIPGRSFA